jgi:hypothetical protein
MKIEFKKEVIEQMIEEYGKEKTIEEMVNSCRVFIEQTIQDMEKNNNKPSISGVHISGNQIQ